MANELGLTYSATGQNLYARLFNASQQVWSTVAAAFVPFVVADVGNYDLPLTETPAGSYLYAGDFPSVITAAGNYEWRAFLREGGTPAITDPLVWEEEIEWAGAAATPVGLAPAGAYTRTTYQTNGVTPIPGAEVYLSSDAAGMSRTATATSDSLGRTEWTVTADFYVWESHPLFPHLEENSPVLVEVL